MLCPMCPMYPAGIRVLLFCWCRDDPMGSRCTRCHQAWPPGKISHSEVLISHLKLFKPPLPWGFSHKYIYIYRDFSIWFPLLAMEKFQSTKKTSPDFSRPCFPCLTRPMFFGFPTPPSGSRWFWEAPWWSSTPPWTSVLAPRWRADLVSKHLFRNVDTLISYNDILWYINVY